MSKKRTGRKRGRRPGRKFGRKGNREYKSDVFSMLLEDRRNALDVYNALNHSSYTDPDAVEIITTDHGISLSIRNDASFLIDRHINYYEHQASFNPNMPLRCLIYYVNDIENDVKYVKEDLYGHRRIALPTPHFVVFYNGTGSRPEKEVMRLSDSFCHKTDEPNMEVVCTAYNINPGFNSELKENSGVLYGYSYFVDRVRNNLANNELADAIKNAVDECINEDILKDFFITRRNEVEKVTRLDFTFETREKMIRRDAKAEGIAEGRNDTIKELQPQIDALKEDNKVLMEGNKTLTEENQSLSDENARLRKALAEAGLSAVEK